MADFADGGPLQYVHEALPLEEVPRNSTDEETVLDTGDGEVIQK